MTILYFGSEMDAAVGSDSTVYELQPGPGTYDDTYSRCCVQCIYQQYLVPGTGSFSSTNKIWIHAFHYFNPHGAGEADILYVRAGSTTVFKLTCALGNVYRMYRWTGAVFAQVGSDVTTAVAGQNLDLFIDSGNSLAQLYVGDSLQTSGSGAISGGITNVRYAGADNAGISYWSQWFADNNNPTVGKRLKTLVEDTNGAVQQWTGAVGTINELKYDDATGVTSSSAGDVSTWYLNGYTLAGSIFGVGTSARFNQSGGPTGIQNALRTASTNYFGSTVTGSASFAVNQNFWATNPNTSAAWVAGQSIEWGVKSIA